MPHEVLVRVAQQVVPVSAVGAEVEPLEDPDQLRETVLHLLPLAELRLVVEVREVDHALEQVVVGVGELADDLVDAVADLLGPLERDHVGEAAPGRHGDVGALVVGRVLVRDVLHEEEREDIVFVLGRVHSAAQLVAALPEGRVEVGFSEGHGGGVGGSIDGWGYLGAMTITGRRTERQDCGSEARLSEAAPGSAFVFPQVPRNPDSATPWMHHHAVEHALTGPILPPSFPASHLGFAPSRALDVTSD